MSPFGIITALLFSGSAGATEPAANQQANAAHSDAETAEQTPEQRLNAAVRLHQTGHPDQAAILLASIANQADLDDEGIRQSARIYLGEVHYLQQNKEEARRLFEAVLLREPDYVMDPFAHPPDVCGFFETIRAYIRPASTPQPAPAPLTAAPRPPASAYMGFGIYQIQHGNRPLGAVMAVGQAAFAAVSIASFVGLMDNRSWGTDDELTRLQTKRAVQWTSTAGFYGLWLWSSIDANRHWRANVRLQGEPSRAGRATEYPQRVLLEVSFPTR